MQEAQDGTKTEEIAKLCHRCYKKELERKKKEDPQNPSAQKAPSIEASAQILNEPTTIDADIATAAHDPLETIFHETSDHNFVCELDPSHNTQGKPTQPDPYERKKTFSREDGTLFERVINLCEKCFRDAGVEKMQDDDELNLLKTRNIQEKKINDVHSSDEDTVDENTAAAAQEGAASDLQTDERKHLLEKLDHIVDQQKAYSLEDRLIIAEWMNKIGIITTRRFGDKSVSHRCIKSKITREESHRILTSGTKQEKRTEQNRIYQCLSRERGRRKVFVDLEVPVPATPTDAQTHMLLPAIIMPAGHPDAERPVQMIYVPIQTALVVEASDSESDS